MIKSNSIALRQLFVTFSLYVGVWIVSIKAMEVSAFFIIPFALIMTFFVLRFFVLMHDCGHGALFPSQRANQIAGYALGVITGMPQFVWSKSHSYHHATNGDWEKFRGALNIKTTNEYDSLNLSQKRNYRLLRHPLSLLFFGGFFYVLFNPRFNWLVGIIKLFTEIFYAVLCGDLTKVKQLLKTVPSKKWKSPREFRHMSYNNITLLIIWYFMCHAIGVYNFFIIYSISLSLAGGLGIIFFTAQHNFENSYAEDTQNTDYVRAAIDGTSYLQLPKWLNWFTADIGYHHIHHLSTSIPNYRLAACHKAMAYHFKDVKRIRWNEINHSIKHLLWDTDKKLIVAFPK